MQWEVKENFALNILYALHEIKLLSVYCIVQYIQCYSQFSLKQLIG